MLNNNSTAPEATIGGVLKKGVLKISQVSKENTFVGVSF